MRKICEDLGTIRSNVKNLMGQSLDILLNPGRNKISTHCGRVTAIYPSLFTLDLMEDETGKKLTCSYSDVLCGKVQLKLREG